MEPHWLCQRFFGSALNAGIHCSRFAKLRAFKEKKNLLAHLLYKSHQSNLNSFLICSFRRTITRRYFPLFVKVRVFRILGAEKPLSLGGSLRSWLLM